ncbi:hypothetical protein [Spirosoma sp. KNUC1025]
MFPLIKQQLEIGERVSRVNKTVHLDTFYGQPELIWTGWPY